MSFPRWSFVRVRGAEYEHERAAVCVVWTNQGLRDKTGVVVAVHAGRIRVYHGETRKSYDGYPRHILESSSIGEFACARAKIALLRARLRLPRELAVGIVRAAIFEEVRRERPPLY